MVDTLMTEETGTVTIAEDAWERLVSQLLQLALRLDNRALRDLMRQAALLWVDALERRDGTTPRTAELRRWYKEQRR
mgnify:CR=1 FL=1